MSEAELRLECLKLAHDWGKLRFREGFSGIGQEDVLEKAQQLYEFCKTAKAIPTREGRNNVDWFGSWVARCREAFAQ